MSEIQMEPFSISESGLACLSILNDPERKGYLLLTAQCTKDENYQLSYRATALKKPHCYKTQFTKLQIHLPVSCHL